MPTSTFHRRLPIGAEPVDSRNTAVRVWAPRRSRVEVVMESGAGTVLTREEAGYFSGVIAASAGDRYRFKLDEDQRLYPDPASRFQPDGPHAASAIVDPSAFGWTDHGWKGVPPHRRVIYEMHIGTFTRAGTWAAAAGELRELARIGITIVEVMPVAEFDGRFGWGYDGVDLFAPSHLYGTPDDFRRFVDAAHAAGLAVILDVVYNHLGPAGNYLREFSTEYFTDRYDNEWGESINFDGDEAGPVREFYVANAGYWIDEFHLDGLRLDATQSIHDGSAEHILAAIAARARAAAGGRPILLVAENEPQDTRLARPIAEGGRGLDALWNDDFHHSAMAALTGRTEAYYSDTRGEPQELISAAKYGYLFQGQQYAWQRDRRGSPAWGLPPSAFVAFTQNHDQIANSVRGQRGHELTSAARWRAMTALLLLLPATPMLFQGQEFSASAPFLYFADFDAELSAAVRRGRAEFLAQFPSIAGAAERGDLPDPGAAASFERSKLDFRERESHAPVYALHVDLLRMRHEDAAFAEPRPDAIDGAVLSASAFALRFFAADPRDERLLVVNLGADLQRASFAEPLLAAPALGTPSGRADADWTLRWSSEELSYGGGGVADPFPDDCWHIPADSALLFKPGPRRPRRPLPLLRKRD